MVFCIDCPNGKKYLVNEIDTVFSFYKAASAEDGTLVPYYAVAKNGKWGIIDATLKWKIQPKYDEIKRCKRMCDGYCDSESTFYGIYFLVREGANVYFINTEGKKYVGE